jgi:hypothetical protein
MAATHEENTGLLQNRGASMVSSPEKRKNRLGNDETGTNSKERVYHDIENDEGYLVVVMEFAGTRWNDRESSLEVCQKLAFLELRRPICEATSGGLGNGPYF